MTIQAYGEHYFAKNSINIAIRQIGDKKAPQHQHDLTDTKHLHNFAELVVVSRGSGLQWIDGIEYELTAGDVFLLQGEKEHYFTQRHNLALTNIMFDPDTLELPMALLKKIPGYHALFLLEPHYRHRQRSTGHLRLDRIALASCESLIAALDKELREQPLGFEAKALNLLLDIMIFLARAYSQQSATAAVGLLKIANVISSLESDCARQWKLPELAEIAYMSQSGLLATFKEATGTTPIDYLISIRIQKAITLMREEGLSLTAIALAVGFNDSNYFSRCFKKQTGMSPRSYRSLANH